MAAAAAADDLVAALPADGTEGVPGPQLPKNFVPKGSTLGFDLTDEEHVVLACTLAENNKFFDGKRTVNSFFLLALQEIAVYLTGGAAPRGNIRFRLQFFGAFK